MNSNQRLSMPYAVYRRLRPNKQELSINVGSTVKVVNNFSEYVNRYSTQLSMYKPERLDGKEATVTDVQMYGEHFAFRIKSENFDTFIEAFAIQGLYTDYDENTLQTQPQEETK